MDPQLFTTRPRWTAIARIVSQRLGKTYGGHYVQQVAAGGRTSAPVAVILKELGVMPKEAEELKPSKPGPKPKKESKA